jgi:uncharacterized lipoprotein YbaY
LNESLEELVVTGEVFGADWGTAAPGAELVVRLEESSRADARSSVIAETRLPLPSQETRIPFRLEAGGLDPRATYRITATLDLDGDGRIGKGDYLNMASFPVITRGFGRHVVVEIRRVN